ncbi:MAG: YjgP/YjgQ family permease [Planctomycetes bacterium]|nr:YjgP/YjgQ family permease [Planctomycetota bacterium]
MVFTLHRYILRELLRVFVLTTVTLTFVLSLSSMLRPIQEFGVGPGQAVHILGYFIPIILTVVLPMSALFSASLVYGRFAGDNELDACRASGISLMTLIYPGLCLAVAISITTLILSFHVVPAFVARAEKSIQGNAKQILFRNIQRKGFYEIPGDRHRIIYADQAFPATDTLVGVVVVDSKNKTINKRMFARRAKIQIETARDSTKVAIIAQEAYQIDEHNIQSAYLQEFSVEMTFPPMLGDDIKFQKLDRLKEIQADMSNFEPVREVAIAAKNQLATELLSESIRKQIAIEDNNYYQMRSENRVIMFTAAGCSVKGEGTVVLSPPIELREYDVVLEPLHKWYSDEPGTIEFKDDVMDPAPVLILKNASWERVVDGYKSPTPVPRRVIEGLTLSETIKSKLHSKKLLDLMETIPADSAEPILENPPSKELSKLYRRLKNEIRYTSRDITAEIHSRLVFGIGSIVLILIAIALGISLKGGHMLSAFGISALPAGALVVFVISGKQLTKTLNTNIPEYAGPLMMWFGVVFLCIVTVILYRKLMRT